MVLIIIINKLIIIVKFQLNLKISKNYQKTKNILRLNIKNNFLYKF